MTKVRRGGYIFFTWKGDHGPRHVHVTRDGMEIVKWNLDRGVPISGWAPPKLVKLIERLDEEGRL